MNIYRKLLILVFIIIISAFIFVKIKFPYERNYFEKLGIDRHNYTFNDLLNDYGPPIEWVDNDEETGYPNVIYNDFILRLSECSPNDKIVSVDIISSAYKFGFNKIGVGSTKLQVECAYMFFSKSPDSTKDMYAYVDGNIYVRFYFNNNIVKKITFFEYG